MRTISESKCFGGVQGVYAHDSAATGTEMTFGLFLPEEARDGPVPVLWFLSGLTCTHANAMEKSTAQGWAAEQGIAVVFPDTSPRGEGVADDAAFDLGQGAGFYVNATEAPWAPHYRMWDYVADELPALITEKFAIDAERQAITGHSMGGHGALTLALSLPGRYRSVSAFAPICNPMKSDWGRKQFTAYLGADEAKWHAHDASVLMFARHFDGPVLIDTGTDDEHAGKLGTAAMAAAVAQRCQPATLRLQAGYGHNYFFVSSFMEDHVSFHAEALWK